MTRTSTRLAGLVAAGVLLLGAVACSNADPSEPEPSTEPSQTPTETTPAWHDKYMPKQIQAYEEAVAHWEEWQAQARPFLAKGIANKKFRKLLGEYWRPPMDAKEFQNWERLASEGIKVLADDRVLWSRPRSVTRDGLVVFIEQCVSPTGVTTQNGKPLPRPIAHPVVRVIDVNRLKPTAPWLITTLTVEEKQRCDAE